MRRIFAHACAVLGAAASAAPLLIASEVCAQTPLLDPGWQLAYPAGQPNSGRGGFITYTFSDGSGQYAVRGYQPPPVYYRRAAQPQAYQSAPRYYAVVPAQQLRAYQQPSPQYYAVVPAQQPRTYQQPTPQYYAVVPAQQPRTYQQPAPQYYAVAPPQQTRGYQPAPVYYQPYQAAPQYEQPQAVQQPVLRNDFAVAYAPSGVGDMMRRQVDPRYDRQVVDYQTDQPPGTIVIDTPHFFLYLVMEGGKALRYGVGVGRPGFTWAGMKEVSAKREWPDWRPPDDMLKRRPDLPRFMPGGPENPLGARAIYLGSTLYRIHGSSEPWTIGTQVSSGCIRLRNEDIIDLYGRVKVGSKVMVI